jgi:enterochelin esterase family protein
MMTLPEQVTAQGTPLIDQGAAGDMLPVTFIWQGQADPPHLVGDFTNWGHSPLALEEREPGVWAHTIPLPRDAYVEYAFMYPGAIDERVSDPYNPRVIWNGVDAVNHVLPMPDFKMTDLIRRGAGVPRGIITRHHIDTLGLLVTPYRDLLLYKPPVDAPVPLVVVWDGTDYASRAFLPAIVDNLIAAKRIQPIALAMIANGRDGRTSEYCCNDATLAFVIEKLIPFANEHLDLVDPTAQPGAYGVLGASMGGLMALWTGLRLPHLFGRVISQSGAFFGNMRADFLLDLYLKHLPPSPLTIWQDVGQIEWLLNGNRHMHALLTEQGYRVTYREFSGGHNYTMWADNVWRGLEAVFGA